EGARVALGRIRRAYDSLVASAELLVVEGAGGLLGPLARGLTTAELIQTLDLPVLIVARPSLGTVNHTLLTIEAARRRNLEVLGVIFSRTRDKPGPDEPSNPAAVETPGLLNILGPLPRLPKESLDNRLALAAAAEQHLQVEKILS